jgi:calcineurin-like phosphoesterase family protein
LKLWFTSDLHLGHANIIRHCNRPFATAEEMDAELIGNINAVVKPCDRLFILGDFCGQRRQFGYIKGYLDRIKLNPQQMVLILGNHDNEKESRKAFPYVHHLHTVKHEGQAIVLCHYAMRVWHGSHRGRWHLYGHSHGSLAEDPHARSFDVGVDCWGYKPIDSETVAAKMALKEWRPVDHHTEDVPSGSNRAD